MAENFHESVTMTWLSVLPVLGVSIALLLVPGLIVTSPFRMGFLARIALSGTVTVALIGVSGVLFSVLRVPFSAWQPLILAFLLGMLLWLFGKRYRFPVFPRDSVSFWWILLSIILTAILIAVVTFWNVPSPERFSQSYDNVFHFSAIEHILTSGDASSLTLRTLIQTNKSIAFYPSAWHSSVALVVQLTGASIPVATNMVWVAVCTVLWIPGVAWLAQLLLRHRYRANRVALVAIPLAAAFGAMPYALLNWGTLYPTFLATAVLPTALAICVLFVQRRTYRSHHGVLFGLLTAMALVAVLAIFFSQPRVLVSLVLIGLPFLVPFYFRALRAAWEKGGKYRRRVKRILWIGGVILVVLLSIAFVYLILGLGFFSRPLSDRLSGPQARATQTIFDGLWQVLSASWALNLSTVTAPSIVLALGLMGGLVLAVRFRGLRWLAISYALVALLFALAAGSDSVLAKLLTALWYKDRFRLSSLVSIMGVVLAALAILWLSALLARKKRKREVFLATGLGWLVTLTSAATLLFSGVTSTIGQTFSLPASGQNDAYVSQKQIDFFEKLSDIVPDDKRVLGDPWDGSAWSQVWGQREPVFPHLNGTWDDDRLMLAQHLAEIETDPVVCAALNNLRVRYVLYNPHLFLGGDPAGDVFGGIRTAVNAGLFTPVASDGTTTLYRIDQCGSLP